MDKREKSCKYVWTTCPLKANEMNDFRERLQQAARWAGAGESQATMATSLSLNRQTINRWFQGGEPNADMLLHIARTWGVDAEWLKSGKGEMLPKPSADGLSGEERDLIKHYRSATPQVRQVISTMARAVRKSMVAIAMAIPPLLAPNQADASISHNLIFAAVEQITHCVRRLRRMFGSRLSFSSLFPA